MAGTETTLEEPLFGQVEAGTAGSRAELLKKIMGFIAHNKTIALPLLETTCSELAVALREGADEADVKQRLRNFLEQTQAIAGDELQAKIAEFLDQSADEVIDLDLVKQADATRKVLGKSRKATLAYYWSLLCMIAPEEGRSILVNELAILFVSPEEYQEKPELTATAFHPIVKLLCNRATGIRISGEKTSSHCGLKLLALSNVLAASQMFLAQVILINDVFMEGYVTADVEYYLGHIYSTLGTFCFFALMYALSELKDLLLPEKSGCNRFFEFVFPELSGITGHWWFSFFARPFLYVFAVSLMLKVGETSNCTVIPEPNSTSINTTTAVATTPEANVTTLLPSPFGNAMYRPDYPAMGTMFAWGLFVSTAVTVLSWLDPSTPMFAGQKRARSVQQRFESDVSSRTDATQRIWEIYGAFFETPISNAAGIFGCFAYFAAACVIGIGANIAMTTLAPILILRFLAFPPEFVGRCAPKISKACRNVLGKLALLLTIGMSLGTNLYFLSIYYYFFCRANFKVDLFNNEDFASTLTQLFWGLYAPWMLGSIYGDEIVDGKKSLITNDQNFAANVRQKADKLLHPVARENILIQAGRAFNRRFRRAPQPNLSINSV